MNTDLKVIKVVSNATKNSISITDTRSTIRYECKKKSIINYAVSEKAIMNVDFKQCRFREGYFREMWIENCVFDHCELYDMMFYCCNFINCTFIHCDICHDLFKYGSMQRCTIQETRISDTNFIKVSLLDTEFIKVETVDTEFPDCRLGYTINPPYVPLSCPTHGSFIGWKRVFWQGNKLLIKLRIPASAKRSSATSHKCRAEYAKVLGIYTTDLKRTNITKVVNDTYARCVYEVGEMVYPDSFDDQRHEQCSHGIHFFIDVQDAINY